mmetsp:Transcript_80456/g.230943  ORF Transcript_80456/g.230943 Transcript_80456/m.230943 type:complete len:204 (+) Transcript_80456:1584-2195(+)
MLLVRAEMADDRLEAPPGDLVDHRVLDGLHILAHVHIVDQRQLADAGALVRHMGKLHGVAVCCTSGVFLDIRIAYLARLAFDANNDSLTSDINVHNDATRVFLWLLIGSVLQIASGAKGRSAAAEPAERPLGRDHHLVPDLEPFLGLHGCVPTECWFDAVGLFMLRPHNHGPVPAGARFAAHGTHSWSSHLLQEHRPPVHAVG